MSINVAEMHHLANMLGSANIPYEIEELWAVCILNTPTRRIVYAL